MEKVGEKWAELGAELVEKSEQKTELQNGAKSIDLFIDLVYNREQVGNNNYKRKVIKWSNIL